MRELHEQFSHLVFIFLYVFQNISDIYYCYESINSGVQEYDSEMMNMIFVEAE